MMIDEENFIRISALICEPVRAKMLWNLLDGRSYTASELAMVADVSATSASNHLARLTEAGLVKVETQGRYRYFSFSRPEVAYVVESLANLAGTDVARSTKQNATVKGIQYCRSCYDHLAGFVGVRFAEALEKNGIIKKAGTVYEVTGKGWKWFSEFGISENELIKNRRPITRQCLDWSERRPHLAGQLGALILKKMLQKGWFRKVRFSREMVITSRGSQELYSLLNIDV